MARNLKNLKRKILYPFAVDSDEYEYLNRKAKVMRKSATISAMLRGMIFTPGWRGRLTTLRKLQGANL